MRASLLLPATALLLGACAREPDGAPATDRTEQAREAKPAPSTAPRWGLQSSGDGVALALALQTGGTTIRLACAADQNRLLVNVPAFKPVGSEERLSFGSGGEAVALVADPSGDSRHGGVTGTAPVPPDLAALVSGPVSASYGAQTSGPHSPPPDHLARAFVAACGTKTAEPARPPAKTASACLTQDGKPVPAVRLRAIGTEPFWGARIEGRCVTYSHPEDQQGTRVWTRFSGSASSGVWSGSLGGSPFVLRTRPQPGCSDGMSDNRYPIAVALTVDQEQRTGCAEPR